MASQDCSLRKSSQVDLTRVPHDKEIVICGLVDAAALCRVRTDGRPRGRTFRSSPRSSGPMTKEENRNVSSLEQYAFITTGA